MSKYNSVWEYIFKSCAEKTVLTFDDIERLAGVKIDHSFLNCKKELTGYGYKVGKISMKIQTVEFVRIT